MDDSSIHSTLSYLENEYRLLARYCASPMPCKSARIESDPFLGSVNTWRYRSMFPPAVKLLAIGIGKCQEFPRELRVDSTCNTLVIAEKGLSAATHNVTSIYDQHWNYTQLHCSPAS